MYTQAMWKGRLTFGKSVSDEFWNCLLLYTYIYIYIYIRRQLSIYLFTYLYYKKQFHSNYKIDGHILKNLIQKNVLPTDPTKKVRLIIYYNKFKTSNLIISNNLSPSTELLDRTNGIYMFKCPLRDCVSKENMYVGLTTTTLSRLLTMHLNDSSSIAFTS